MDKLIWLPSVDGYGQQSSETLFIPKNTFEKTAGKYTKNVQQYVDRDLKPDVKRYLYMLLHAVGATEYFGSNSNGDAFDEAALKHEGEDYGHKTFERYAKLYKHHINKDPARSYGDVLYSDYDDNMHRVLLVVGIDRDKAPDICHKIEVQGLFPDVSMGCKVPFDECSICFHRSPTSSDYCTHAKNEMGRIYPDGRKVFVRNPNPRFFDISQVFRGAEAPAKFMHKVAGSVDPRSAEELQKYFWLGLVPDLDKEIKLAASRGTVVPSVVVAEKLGYTAKESQMVKEVPSITNKSEVDSQAMDLVHKGYSRLRSNEPAIPSETLAKLSSFPIRNTLGTLTKMGIALRPSEFQYIGLMKMGMRNEADFFASKNIVFDMSKMDNEVEPMYLSTLDFDPDVEKIAHPLQPGRSDLQPYLFERVANVIHAGERPMVKDYREEQTNIIRPLNALALIYLAYKAGLMEQVKPIHRALRAVEEMAGVQNANPMAVIPITAAVSGILSGIQGFRGPKEDKKTKLAGDELSGSVTDLAILTGAALLPQLYRKQVEHQIQSGEEPSAVGSLVHENPWAASTLAVLAAALAKPKLVEKGQQFVDYIKGMKQPPKDAFGKARPYIYGAAMAYPYVQREITNKKLRQGEEPSVPELVVANNPLKSAIIGSALARLGMNWISEKVGKKDSVLTKMSSDYGWSNLLHGILLNPLVTKVASQADYATASAGTVLGLAVIGCKEENA